MVIIRCANLACHFRFWIPPKDRFDFHVVDGMSLRFSNFSNSFKLLRVGLFWLIYDNCFLCYYQWVRQGISNLNSTTIKTDKEELFIHIQVSSFSCQRIFRGRAGAFTWLKFSWGVEERLFEENRYHIPTIHSSIIITKRKV